MDTKSKLIFPKKFFVVKLSNIKGTKLEIVPTNNFHFIFYINLFVKNPKTLIKYQHTMRT